MDDNHTLEQDWPADADGDVFRRMHADGFDFATPASIDFNVDFDDWPPSGELISALAQRYAQVEVHEPDEYRGYVSFVVTAKVSYELVMSVQRSVSELAAPYGGVCESWGVMQ
ncbi:ribonuclease E inhibitor RraB [Pseudoduganella sp. HUAS MS19]